MNLRIRRLVPAAMVFLTAASGVAQNDVALSAAPDRVAQPASSTAQIAPATNIPGEAAQLGQALTLQQAKETALRNHPRYAAAQLRGFLAQEKLKETRAAYYPAAAGYVDAVGATDSGTRVLAGGFNNPTIYNRIADGISVNQLITDFGRTGNLTASAKYEVQAENADQESSREQVLLNVETSYLAALEAQSVLAVARETLASRQLVVNQVQALENSKMKSSLDVSFAEVALEEANLLIQQSEGQAEGTMASLSAALGYRRPQVFLLSDQAQTPALPGDAEKLLDAALRNRPDLRRLRFQRDAALSVAAAEKDANYPTLAAVGLAGNAPTRDPHLPANYAVAGVQLSIPIVAGGAYLAREREAKYRARIADEALREAEDSAARDVRLAWVGVKTSLQKLHTTEQLVKHASDAFTLAQVRYKVGSSSVIELSEAQLAQTNAAITQAGARYETLIQAALLDFQTGDLN